MMAQKHIVVVLVFLLAMGVCLGQKQEAGQDKQSQYASLLSRVKNGDLTIDFQQLRLSYMDSPERHQAKDTGAQEKEMWQALNQKEFKKAIDAADVVLANEFV